MIHLSNALPKAQDSADFTSHHPLVQHTPPQSRLRHLDLDDLYLIGHLGKGLRLIDAAKLLYLSQSAITQRIHKIETAMGFEILDRSIRGTRLSERGHTLSQNVLIAIKQLENLDMED